MLLRSCCIGFLFIANGLPISGALARGVGISYFNVQGSLFGEGAQPEEILGTIRHSLTPRTLFLTHEGGWSPR